MTALTGAVRRALDQELAGILRGTEAQRSKFLEQVVEALEAHRELTESLGPPVRTRKPRQSSARFNQLGSAARRVASVFGQLDQRERQWLSTIMSANGASVTVIERWLSQAPDCARSIDAAATRIGKDVRQNSTRKPMHILMTLIPDLAAAYGETYQRTPSAAPMGTFYRTVDTILRHAKIPRPGGRVVKRMMQQATGRG